MAIEETNHIERVVLAFRGDLDGSFKGAHLERFNVIKRDGVEIVRQPGKATTISEAAAAGFTWPEVAAGINAGLILASEQQAAQIVAQAEQIAVLTGDKAAADQARDAALAQVAELQAQLATHQPAVIDGVPQAVDMVKFCVYATRIGILATVEAAVDAAGPEAVQIWKRSKTVQRQNALMLTLARDVFHWTDAEIDGHFIEADKVVI